MAARPRFHCSLSRGRVSVRTRTTKHTVSLRIRRLLPSQKCVPAGPLRTKGEDLLQLLHHVEHQEPVVLPRRPLIELTSRDIVETGPIGVASNPVSTAEHEVQKLAARDTRDARRRLAVFEVLEHIELGGEIAKHDFRKACRLLNLLAT